MRFTVFWCHKLWGTVLNKEGLTVYPDSPAGSTKAAVWKTPRQPLNACDRLSTSFSLAITASTVFVDCRISPEISISLSFSRSSALSAHVRKK